MANDVTIDKAILKINAHQKPSTCMPSTSFAASKIIIALITKAKKPNVIIVKGNPNKLRIGFTIRFKIPKTIAKITAPPKLSKLTPGIILVSKKATIAVIKSQIIKFIVSNF